MNKNNKVKILVKIAILSTISYILFLMKMVIPIFPSFLKFDFSDLPALIASFAISPLVGVAVELFKNLLHLPMTSTAGVGELANFLIGSAFVLPAGIIYQKHRTKKCVLSSLGVSILSTSIVGVLTNYFILIPLYSKFIPLDSIIAMSNAVIPMIKDKFTLVIFGILPFNILKGTIISIVTLLIYKKISFLLK